MSDNDQPENARQLENAPNSSNLSLTYAGRLDPLASGLLIALEGEEIKDKERFLGLDKTYEFEVVFGIATDTFDQLGVIFPSNDVLSWPTLSFGKKTIDQNFIQDILKNDSGSLSQVFDPLLGKVKISYPFYSSKPIDGKPLFQYVKDNGIEATIPRIPTIETEIFEIELLNKSEMDAGALAEESLGFVEMMKGDFRQDEIKESWNDFKRMAERGGEGAILPPLSLPVLKFRMKVSSGFYIRSFAFWLGQIAGTGAIARNIVRTRVGEYSLS